MKKRLLILGGGFSGFWSAMSAIRRARELCRQDELEVVLINKNNYLTIRPRLYEISLDGLRIELDQYTRPLGIRLLIGAVELIRPAQKEILVNSTQGLLQLSFDYLILATGSVLRPPDLPGIEYSYNIDTFEGAQRLDDHLNSLANQAFNDQAATTFVIVGGGFIGLEMVTSIVEKAEYINSIYANKKRVFKAIIIERSTEIAKSYPEESRSYIKAAIAEKKIEVITGVQVSSITNNAVILSDGREILTRTAIWTVSRQASPLTEVFDGKRDELNRLHVDNHLKLPEYNNVIITGDVANVSVDEGQKATMACQYSNFQGKWAGHNAVNDLFGEPLKAYIHNGYVTCLDLGTDNALVTRGWDREIELTGNDARDVKMYINTQLIYPPVDVEEALIASYPEIPLY